MDDKSKPAARRGRKAKGPDPQQSRDRQPGYRRDDNSLNLRRLVAAGTVATCLLFSPAYALAASAPDTDRDGLPNSWEKTYKLNWKSAEDADDDNDSDGLDNREEYQRKGNPRDEDTDNDGQDDGDEVETSTSVAKADTDKDKVLDGDEDADGDGVANEDEDDSGEACVADDDDRDADNVDDEDENELRLKVTTRDSDKDKILDGEEDFDGDALANEDEDDAQDDECSADGDGDGVDDEDESDAARGAVTSFEAASGAIVITTTPATGSRALSYLVTAETEVEVHRSGDAEDEKGMAAITVGASVEEYEVRKGSSTLKELKLRA